MDLGSEITSRLKSAIKTKLQELGSYIDDELPEYILVMISNKRSPSQMKDDLSLFLGDDTEKFVSWVFTVLSKLQEATDPADSNKVNDEITVAKDTKEGSEAKKSKEDPEVVKCGEKGKRTRSSSSTERIANEKGMPSSGQSSTNKSGKSDETKKSSKKETIKKKDKRDKEVTDKDVASKQAGTKRQISSDSEEEQSQINSIVASKVEIQKKQSARPTLPVARQASGHLLKRAMEEARKSVKNPGLVASHEYSHDNSEAVAWIQDPELREQQKQVLLRQHRELEELRNIKDQLKKQKAIMDKTLPSVNEDEDAALSTELRERMDDRDNELKDDIELEVNDNEFLEDWIEVTPNAKDRRVIDVGESAAFKNEQNGVGNDAASSTTNIEGVAEKENVHQSEQGDSKLDARKERDARREIRSSRSTRDRHSKRRHGRSHRTYDRQHHDRKQDLGLNFDNIGEAGGLLSPRFVVTLNGIDSDYEKKFDDESRRDRRKRKFNDSISPSSSDTLFINLDKRTSNLKPLEIMQQALLTIQQPLLQGQGPFLPPALDLGPQNMPLPSAPTDPYRPFDLRNHLGPPQNTLLPSLNPIGPDLSINQTPLGPHPLPPNRISQATSRNLTNLVPLSVAAPKNDVSESKNEASQTGFASKASPSRASKKENEEHHNIPSVEKVRIRLDSGSADDEENEMETEAILERCRFWPECKNGVSCAYVHPTVPCKSFPSCAYSDKCIFLHPVCKFDGRCTNVSCPYTHTSKQKMYGGSGIPPATTASDANTPLCRFYPNCSKKYCTFRHPLAKPCRYGSGCTRSNCLFIHETKPADRSSLTWTAISKEPKPKKSNRQFACPESAVTAVPVSVST